MEGILRNTRSQPAHDLLCVLSVRVLVTLLSLLHPLAEAVDGLSQTAEVGRGGLGRAQGDPICTTISFL